ncbi:MAG: zinc ribbon domain-containing protein [Deltaproteobacteria bacterium]|jgi:putative FmdB family regulatory protein|nr:zinc ribbon domain-containing protein [Deltaproteobacteria bacterium]
MPIYEFKCLGCGRVYEELVFKSSQEIRCPGCGSEKSEKLLSSFRSRTGGDGGDFSAGGSSCGGCTASSCAGCGVSG